MPSEVNKRLSIEDLAEWFLAKEPMTHKKLQKLCYYAVAWGYALYEKKFFEQDTFEAWIHGPVSLVLYQKYKNNGWSEIEQPQGVPVFSDEVTYLLESVWKTYGDKNGDELEAISHNESPWKEARKGLSEDERGNNEIDPRTMVTFYKSIYTGED